MKKRRLSTHLILYISIFSVITFMAMMALVLVVSQKNIETLITEKAEDILTIVDLEANHYLNHPLSEIDQFKYYLENGDEDLARIVAQMHQYVYRFELVDENGIIVNTYPNIDQRIGFDLSSNRTFTDIKYSSNDYEIGEVVIDPYKQEPTITISRKMNDKYLVAYLVLTPFNELLKSVDINSGQVAIVDDHGTYISHTDPVKVEQRAVDPFAQKIRNGELASNSSVKYDGESSVLHYRKIEGSHWYILYYQNTDAITMSTLKVVLSNLLIMMILLSLFLLGVMRISRKTGASLKKLDQATLAVEKGDYALAEKDLEFEFLEFEELFNRVQSMSIQVETREEEVIALNNELESNYYTTIVLLAKAIDAKDNYTGNHSVRVRDFSLMLAEELDLTERELRELRFGATLHDIGKLGVAESVLNKPGRLTDEEYALIKRHSQMGYDIVEELPGMAMAKQIILHHHERYDGKGYPYGLKGKEIPLLARIVAIADSFDAMTTQRPYRKAHMSKKEGFDELRRHAGIQFDSDLVEIFIEKIKKG